MGWIRNSAVFLLVLSLYVISVAEVAEAARGQSKEKDAMWNVENTEKKQIVPSYTGGDSPFPVQIKSAADLKLQRTDNHKRLKRVVVKRKKPSKGADNSEQISELLKEIRSIIAAKQAYNPNTDTIRIDGRIDSTFGAKVLIHDRWFSVGENILVSIMQTNELLNLIEELKSLDSNLAEIVSGDLKTKMEESKHTELVLTKIGKDFVELKDNLGKTHVISFVINSL